MCKSGPGLEKDRLRVTQPKKIVKLLEKGAKAEFTFTQEGQKNNGVTFKIQATG